MKGFKDDGQVSRISGSLEIHHNRGVIYFHADEEAMKQGVVATPLRISSLGLVPTMKGFQIDTRSDKTINERFGE